MFRTALALMLVTIGSAAACPQNSSCPLQVAQQMPHIFKVQGSCDATCDNENSACFGKCNPGYSSYDACVAACGTAHQSCHRCCDDPRNGNPC